MKLAEVLEAVKAWSVEDRRKLSLLLRREFAHKLETDWGLDADTILDAIARSGDLTQRGIRGVIAESVFVREVLPAALKGSDWIAVEDDTTADVPYDAVVENAKSKKRLRIQVKNQRREKGVPKESGGCWIVEVQKTRSGEKNGEATRPYRFTDFDVIAVCMYPSCGDWRCFAFSLASDLKPRKDDRSLIEIMQPIPKSLDGDNWSRDLVATLNSFGKSPGERLGELFG